MQKNLQICCNKLVQIVQNKQFLKISDNLTNF